MVMWLCYCMCMYVGKHAWYMYVLTSIFMQADMHKSLHVIMCACTIYVSMYIYVEEESICMYVDKHA